MGLSIGIVGLPNVGKSSLFNALTRSAQAQSANYPFCTIDPNKAIVDVPDTRLQALARIVKPERIQHSSVEFVDIAGLIKGASQGEGLGNQFLAHVRECAVILHVVRCFEDSNVVHVSSQVDPLADMEVIEIELILADIQSLQKRLERLEKLAKSSKPAHTQLEFARALLAHLNELKSADSFAQKDHPLFAELNQELRFLSAKKVIYVANVGEEEVGSLQGHALKVQERAMQRGAHFVHLSAKLEEELGGMEEGEAREFLASLGIAQSGLDQVIRLGFEVLGLMSYFTAGVKEVRAWTIERGSKAPEAAGVIHKDFEKGFIRAETIAYADFIAYGGEQGAKEKGALRIEGKDYIVQDGDVMHFRFHV
ncbi:redox-regulated ATPase YchF [Helicobacter cynogastricus]|uniref:redox-regulated ATPase YchF n=1 Tax=Helicobacter cynogastricus TaxID=329937 RepID=UPI000CF1C446|nr:redox-regulated ATPase YchF [Helicobacter cynogastricus]